MRTIGDQSGSLSAGRCLGRRVPEGQPGRAPGFGPIAFPAVSGESVAPQPPPVLQQGPTPSVPTFPRILSLELGAKSGARRTSARCSTTKGCPPERRQQTASEPRSVRRLRLKLCSLLKSSPPKQNHRSMPRLSKAPSRRQTAKVTLRNRVRSRRQLN